MTFHCCFFYEEVDIFEHVGLLKEILWTILCFVTCAMRVALICPLLSKLDQNYTWNLNCAFWYPQMPEACNEAIWLLCACETSKRDVIFISCFVFVWCQHDWTGPCSADLKDGLSLMSTALQSFPTFSLCSNICSLFLWAACLKNCVSSNKTLWNGNLLMYTLQCRPVWKSLEEYIMDEKISSLMRSIYWIEISVLGTGNATKTDGFSKKFQTTFRLAWTEK